ncbi:MAG: hypothetical protein HDT37_05200 [Clostridiales bacterium]|nr:hypothetical protein [Clostridiales bacterium]
MNSEEKFSKEELFALYKLEIDRENEIRTKWRSSFNVYLTMLLSIISAVFVFANFLSESHTGTEKYCFMIGGGIVTILAIIAFFHFKLDYRYQMEILSVQAKIEDMLGLTCPEKCTLPQRWGAEALLPPWYYDNEAIHSSSSKEFIDYMCSMKSMNFYPLIYAVFAFIGVLLVVVSFLMC